MTDNKTKNTKGILIRLGKYVFKEWPLFISAVIFTLLSNQLSLLGPKYSGAAIDAVGLSGGTDFDAVFENVVRMAVCYAISAILAYFLAPLMWKALS